MRPSETPKAKRKSKLKMRYWNELDKAINHAMEKVWLLCELQCEKRQADLVSKLATMTKPAHLPKKPVDKPRLPRYSAWGLDRERFSK